MDAWRMRKPISGQRSFMHYQFYCYPLLIFYFIINHFIHLHTLILYFQLLAIQLFFKAWLVSEGHNYNFYRRKVSLEKESFLA